MDLRVVKSLVLTSSPVKHALVASRPGASHQSTREPSFTRSLDIRSPRIQAKRYQSNWSSEMDVDLVHWSTKRRSTSQTGTNDLSESQPGTSHSDIRSMKRGYRSSPRGHRSRSNHRSPRSRYHIHHSSSHSGSLSRSKSKSSSYSSYRPNSSDREGRHTRRSHRHRSISGHRHSKRQSHSSVSRHRRHVSRKPGSRDLKRSMGRRSRISRTHTVRRHTSRSESVSSDKDNISVRVDHNKFEGESMTGYSVKNSSKSLRKRGSDSD